MVSLRFLIFPQPMKRLENFGFYSISPTAARRKVKCGEQDSGLESCIS
jgi:hypothetical protein